MFKAPFESEGMAVSVRGTLGYLAIAVLVCWSPTERGCTLLYLNVVLFFLSANKPLYPQIEAGGASSCYTW
jgi:hypothetical protein